MVAPAQTTYFFTSRLIECENKAFSDPLANLCSEKVVGTDSQRGFFARRFIALGSGLEAFTAVALEAVIIPFEAARKITMRLIQLDFRGALNQGKASAKQLWTALKVTVCMIPLIIVGFIAPEYAYASIAEQLHTKRNECDQASTNHDNAVNALMTFLGTTEISVNTAQNFQDRVQSLSSELEAKTNQYESLADALKVFLDVSELPDNITEALQSKVQPLFLELEAQIHQHRLLTDALKVFLDVSELPDNLLQALEDKEQSLSLELDAQTNRYESLAGAVKAFLSLDEIPVNITEALNEHIQSLSSDLDTKTRRYKYLVNALLKFLDVEEISSNEVAKALEDKMQSLSSELNIKTNQYRSLADALKPFLKVEEIPANEITKALEDKISSEQMVALEATRSELEAKTKQFQELLDTTFKTTLVDEKTKSNYRKNPNQQTFNAIKNALNKYCPSTKT